MMLGPREPSGPAPLPRRQCLSLGRGVGRADCHHGPVGASGSPEPAGAVSPGDESQPCRCACHFCFCSRCKWGRASPRDHPYMPVPVSSSTHAPHHASGAPRVHTHIHARPPPPHTHPESASGLWGEPSSQTAGCPVWEPRLSLLLTKPGVEGTKQEGAGFRPQGPPTSYRAVGSLLTRLYPGEPGPPRLR